MSLYNSFRPDDRWVATSVRWTRCCAQRKKVFVIYLKRGLDPVKYEVSNFRLAGLILYSSLNGIQKHCDKNVIRRQVSWSARCAQKAKKTRRQWGPFLSMRDFRISRNIRFMVRLWWHIFCEGHFPHLNHVWHAGFSSRFLDMSSRL